MSKHITGPAVRSDMNDTLRIFEDSEAVGTDVEDALDELRNAIGKAYTKWQPVARKMRSEDPEAFKKIDKVMNDLHRIDNEIADIL